MKKSRLSRILAVALVLMLVLSAVPVFAATTVKNNLEVVDFSHNSGYLVSAGGTSVNITVPYATNMTDGVDIKRAVIATPKSSVRVDGVDYTVVLTINGFESSRIIRSLGYFEQVSVSYTLTKAGGTDTITGKTTYSVFLSKSGSFADVSKSIDSTVAYVDVSAVDFGQDKVSGNLCRYFELTSGTTPACYQLTAAGSAYEPGKGTKVESLRISIVPSTMLSYGTVTSFGVAAYDYAGTLIGEGTLNVSVASPVTGKVKASAQYGNSAVIGAAAYTSDICSKIAAKTVCFTSVPSADQGVLYIGTAVAAANKSYEPANLTFVPVNTYKGTVSIPYTCYDAQGYNYSNVIEIEVGKNLAATITKNALFSKSGTTAVQVTKPEIAEAIGLSANANPEVRFLLVPVGLNVTIGSVAIQTGSKWSEKDDKVSIVPTATGTFNLTYSAVYEGEIYNGSIDVVVSDGVLEDIKLAVSYTADAAANVISFKTTAEKVLEASKKALCSEKISDIYLTMMPYSIQGSLSSNYGSFYTDSKAENVAVTQNPYTEESFKALYYAPTKENGTVQLNYTIYDGNKEFFVTGTVTISRRSETDINYSVSKNNTVAFDKADFIKACTAALGNSYTLAGVRFAGSNTGKGILYYTAANTAATPVNADQDYTPEMLDCISFKPENNYVGEANSVTFTATAYAGTDKTATATFVGTVSVSVREQIDVFYQVTAGKSITFTEADFTDCYKSCGGKTLKAVSFVVLPENGSIYENYSSTEKTNTTASAQKLYYSSSATNLTNADVTLNKLTFVTNAEDGNTTVTLDFVMYGSEENSEQKNGILQIRITKGDVSTISGSAYCTGALFSSSSFNKICKTAIDAELSYVQFDSIDANNGALFYGYKSATEYEGKVSADTKYYASGTDNLISKVAFVPVAGFSGLQEIGYTAYDANGQWYKGQLKITIVSKTKSATFTDVTGNYSWAADSVDFLSSNGAVKGLTDTTYGPKQNIKRGDFVLMLYRAFGLDRYDSSAASTENFSDVKADAYYANAIKVARYLEIAKGDGKTFNPNSSITREEAMALIYRTMQKTGWKISHSVDTKYTGFTDTAKVSSYAVECMQYFVQAGIVVGSGNKLNPKQSITRAEMAVILHRVLTF